MQVLGDRSLKLKYLNPNVILVAIGAAEDMVNQAGSVLTILIVDTVTGRVLHRQTHQVRMHLHQVPPLTTMCMALGISGAPSCARHSPCRMQACARL